MQSLWLSSLQYHHNSFSRLKTLCRYILLDLPNNFFADVFLDPMEYRCNSFTGHNLLFYDRSGRRLHQRTKYLPVDDAVSCSRYNHWWQLLVAHPSTSSSRQIGCCPISPACRNLFFIYSFDHHC